MSLARERTLVRAGQFTQVARQAALIAIALSLPRLGLTTDAIGHWEGLLYAGFLLGFGWLTGLTQAFLVTVRRHPAPRAYGRRVLTTVTVVSLLVLTAVALIHPWFFSLLHFGGPPPGWRYFFGYLLVQWPALLFEQLLVVERRPTALVGFGLLSAAGLFACLCGPLYLGYDLTTALWWLFVFSVGRAIVVLLLGVSGGSTGPAPAVPGAGTDLRLLGRTAAPLVAFASLAALTTAFDPWFVNYWFAGDEATFALFRYGTRELPLLAALINGMVVVVLPRLTESRTEGLALLRESSRRLYHWVFPGLILLLLTSRWWWPLLFTETFLPSLPLFHIFVFTVVSRLLFPVPVLTATGHTRWLPAFAALEFVINVGLSFWLATWFGLTGIVWATVIAYLIDKLCLVAYLRYRTGIGPGQYTDLRWYGFYLCLLIAVYFLAGVR